MIGVATLAIGVIVPKINCGILAALHAWARRANLFIVHSPPLGRTKTKHGSTAVAFIKHFMEVAAFDGFSGPCFRTFRWTEPRLGMYRLPFAYQSGLILMGPDWS